MEREPDTDTTLVDLLYGEVDDTARAEAEARVAADAALVGELERLRALRGVLRSWHQETEAAPTRGMEDLLAAARAQVTPARAAVEPPTTRGLWERLSAWMAPLLTHPALAAAATLVLVVGVAGTLYVTRGSRLAEPTDSPAVAPAEPAPEPAPRPVPSPAPEVAREMAPATEAAPRAAAPAEPPRAPVPRAPAKKARTSRAQSSAPALDLSDDVGAAGAREEVAAPTPPPPASAPAAADEAVPVEEAKGSSRRDDLAALTREAQGAARRGDCPLVRTLSGRVRQLDAGYHQRTFRVDRDIAACLAATPAKN